MLSERYGYHPRIWVVTGEKVAAEKVAKGMLCNHRKQGYDISFVGDIESAYSRDAVLFSELEKVALARHMKWGAEEEFWRIEYCYRSSIASAIHKKYKLYCGVPGAEKSPVTVMRKKGNFFADLNTSVGTLICAPKAMFTMKQEMTSQKRITV